MNKSYPILVLEQGQEFYCLIKELSILESGPDLAETYERARMKRQRLVSEFQKAGLERLMNLSPSDPVEKKRFGFSLNFVLLAFLLMVPLTSLTLPAARILKKACKIFEQPLELVIDFGKRLDDMPYEKKKELKRSIQALVAQFDTEIESDSRNGSGLY